MESCLMAGLQDPRFVDPYPWYARMRATEPIYHTPRLKSYALFRYADVVAALREPRFSSQITETFFRRLAPELQASMRDFERSLSLWMLFRDPPDHGRVRNLVARAFTPRLVQGLVPRIEALTDELLDAAHDQSHFDLMAVLAKPLPMLVIAELLGVDATHREKLKQWSNALAVFMDTRTRSTEAAAAGYTSFQEVSAFLLDQADRRRRDPGEDLLSALVAPAGDSGPLLQGDDLVAMGILLLFAGHETTTNLIGNGTLALLRHPEQRELFMSDVSIEVNAIEELLRYDSPVQTVWRIVTEDFRFFGIDFHAGDLVFPRVGSANRDETQFVQPDQLDIKRQNNRHLSFGHGTHFCLGAALSRLEGRIALKALFRRFPSLRYEDDALVWSEHSSLRGLEAFPVFSSPGLIT